MWIKHSFFSWIHLIITIQKISGYFVAKLFIIDFLSTTHQYLQAYSFMKHSIYSFFCNVKRFQMVKLGVSLCKILWKAHLLLNLPNMWESFLCINYSKNGDCPESACLWEKCFRKSVPAILHLNKEAKKRKWYSSNKDSRYHRTTQI